MSNLNQKQERWLDLNFMDYAEELILEDGTKYFSIPISSIKEIYQELKQLE